MRVKVSTPDFHFFSHSSNQGVSGFPAIFKFFIKPQSQNDTALLDSLTATNDPLNPAYGKHLSKSEATQLVAPAPESMEAIIGWLQDHGLTPDAISHSGDVATVRMPLEKANTVLNASYSPYVHEATNTTVWRTLTYSVPAHVEEHLSFVYPTTQFIPPPISPAVAHITGALSMELASKRAPDQLANCAEAMTPRCLQTLYNIPAIPATALRNSIAIGDSAAQVAEVHDLKAFIARERPDITSVPFAMLSVNGTAVQGNGTGSAGMRSHLQYHAVGVQYTVGLATNVSTTALYPGRQNETDGIQGLIDIIDFLLYQEIPPTVFLTNVQYEEAAFQTAPEVAQYICNAFAQLGARGTSVIVASGDSNVSRNTSDASGNDDAPRAMFPATCPYVTSVGSTQGINPESAAQFSSGGFSNLFPRPAYQVDALDGYLKQLGNSSARSINTTGRAYPDASAQGVQYSVLVDGEVQSINSTSASSATFAAIVALLNDRLLNAGKSPLGFLNPLLYSKGLPALTDIVSGGSSTSDGESSFAAMPGWDPVTGLGTPDFQKLLAVVTGSDADSDSSETGSATGQSSPQPTADAIRGSGLEGLFPFTISREQDR
ncbi:subtilisin-like protein [Trametes versicolor FP-101664 SS1]|uniref:subtilisin-like protein n=1 Tax=Trametes versicolor (strain FP-101664) TaxID=717944 RepID=UPI00046243E0|nr:subtilisin-like protein [Trametes versicolor FP-101664 SS1]EIW55941.1 subtilisin-like protein [Trametes versicolor FP-101664 SS1]